MKAEAFVMLKPGKGNKSRTKWKGVETGYRKLISPERLSFLLLQAGVLHQSCLLVKCLCCKDIDLYLHCTLVGIAPKYLRCIYGKCMLKIAPWKYTTLVFFSSLPPLRSFFPGMSWDTQPYLLLRIFSLVSEQLINGFLKVNDRLL